MPTQSEQYLVGPRSAGTGEASLVRFGRAVEGRSDAEIVSAKPGGPMVVQLSKEAFAQLHREFADELIIEPDAPLRL